MRTRKTDKKADIHRDIDRGERITLMEPLLLSSDSRHRPLLSDLALDLATKSARLRSTLPEGVRRALAELVRAMNCYYSNLIEGHDTHPVDIERALKGDYSNDKTKRDLQEEAKAHIAVQTWIDEGGLSGRAATKEGILEIHRRFCSLLPEDLLWVEDSEGKKDRVIPGELRKHDVVVGKHIPISSGALPRFLTRFEEVYSRLGKAETVLATAAAHHRLLWIHPFSDGNGRVARLVSYAQLLDTLETGGIWSVARGLARNQSVYKQHLMACDQTRRNDLDGRGHLSEEALAEFARFFLETCLDQVAFMESLVQPNRLRERILLWAEEEARVGELPSNAGAILEAVLYQGALQRGDVARVIGLSERQGRRVASSLIEKGVLVSKTDRAPLYLSFPATLASRWMPGLFPDLPAPLKIAELTIFDPKTKSKLLYFGLQDFDFSDRTFVFTAYRYFQGDLIYLEHFAARKLEVLCELKDRSETRIFTAKFQSGRMTKTDERRLHPWAQLTDVKIIERRSEPHDYSDENEFVKKLERAQSLKKKGHN